MTIQLKLAVVEEIAVELPIQVVVLLGISHAMYDTKAEIRGWGSEYIGSGVSNGLDHYSTTMETVVDKKGTKIDCVRLTKRPNFHTGVPGLPIDYLFPFEGFRNCALQTLMAIPQEEKARPQTAGAKGRS